MSHEYKWLTPVSLWRFMATVQLVAQRTFPYAGGTVMAGQCFVAMSEADAVLLRTIGHAVEAPHDRIDDEPTESTETIHTPKRRYRRRVDPTDPA